MRHPSPTHSAPNPTSSHTLRKPAPRAQLPVSVHDDGDVGGNEGSYRVQLPSTVPSGVENLTGVGAGHHEQTPDVFYSTTPFHAEPTSPGRLVHEVAPGHHSRSPTPKSGRSTPHDKVALFEDISVTGRSPYTEPNTPPLLGPGVFRDSAFSSNTEMSAEIPIKWTGLVADPVPEDAEPTPNLPGGWQATPAEEKEEAVGCGMDINLDQSAQPEHAIQEVVERVASPTLSEPDMPRKSEAGLIGMVSSTNRKGKEKDTSGHGQGWVMVNVEAPPSAAAEVKDVLAPAEDVTNSQSTDTAESSLKAADGEDITRQRSSPKASMSPAAKAIVIIDAVDQKHKKSKSEQVQSPSRIRRFFSLSRKDSVCYTSSTSTSPDFSLETAA